MNNAAPLMRENKEDVENAEGDCRNGEEIDRGKLFGMVYEKCMPCLRGRLWMPDHVPGDDCSGDVDSQIEQFGWSFW